MELKRLIQCMLLIVLIVMISTFATSCKKESASDEAKVVASSKNQGQSIEVFGKVDVKDTKDIVIDFNARVEKIEIKDEQIVKKGQRLMTLDIDEYRTKLNMKEREIITKKLELAQQKNIISGNYTEIKRLQNDIESKKKRLKNVTDPDILRLTFKMDTHKELLKVSKSDYETMLTYYSTASVTKEELEKAKKQYDLDKNTVDTLSFELESIKIAKADEIKLLESQLDSKLAQVDNSLSTEDSNMLKIMEEAIKNLEDDLAIAKRRLDKSYIQGNDIICDVDNGVVHSIGYNEGAFTSIEKRAFCISSLDSIYVIAEVPEEFIQDVAVGMKAEITPQFDKRKKYTGKVEKVRSKTIEKSGETDIRVEISLADKDALLILDSNVDVEIFK